LLALLFYTLLLVVIFHKCILYLFVPSLNFRADLIKDSDLAIKGFEIELVGEYTGELLEITME
jgi:hypothetical protein